MSLQDNKTIPELQFKKGSDGNEAALFCQFLEESHALDIVSIELEKANAIADSIIICSATSRRHAQGLADGIARLCGEMGHEFMGMEGYDHGEWILLDLNTAILHIFQEEPRKLYRLEALWGANARQPGGKDDAYTVIDS